MIEQVAVRIAIRWIASLVVVVLAVSGVARGGDDPIRTLTPPDMACDVRMMAGDGEALYFLDTCDAILRWVPESGEARAIELEGAPHGLLRLAVGTNRIAVLVGETQEIRVYDASGAFLKRFAYLGESQVKEIAVLGEYVAATTWYDDHLLFMFDDPAAQPRRLIENPQYWPEASPRIGWTYSSWHRHAGHSLPH